MKRRSGGKPKKSPVVPRKNTAAKRWRKNSVAAPQNRNTNVAWLSSRRRNSIVDMLSNRRPGKSSSKRKRDGDVLPNNKLQSSVGVKKRLLASNSSGNSNSGINSSSNNGISSNGRPDKGTHSSNLNGSSNNNMLNLLPSSNVTKRLLPSSSMRISRTLNIIRRQVKSTPKWLILEAFLFQYRKKGFH